MQSQPHTDVEEGSFLPLFPLTLEYNTRQPEKLHTHTRPLLPPLSLSLLQGLMPDSSWFPIGTARGSPKKIFWMLACLQPLKKGTDP